MQQKKLHILKELYLPLYRQNTLILNDNIRLTFKKKHHRDDEGFSIRTLDHIETLKFNIKALQHTEIRKRECGMPQTRYQMVVTIQ